MLLIPLRLGLISSYASFVQNQEGEVMAICVIASPSSLIIPPIFVRWCNYVHDCDFVFWSVFMNVMLSDNYISFSASKSCNRIASEGS